MQGDSITFTPIRGLGDPNVEFKEYGAAIAIGENCAPASDVAEAMQRQRKAQMNAVLDRMILDTMRMSAFWTPAPAVPAPWWRRFVPEWPGRVRRSLAAAFHAFRAEWNGWDEDY